MMRLFFFGLLIFTACLVYAQPGNVGIGTTSPKAQLHATGSVRLDTLSGTGLRPVYVSAQGDLLTSLSYVADGANNMATSIPDISCPGASRSINVTGLSTSIPSVNIQVKLNITHTFVGDLNIYLLAPNGQLLNLAFGEGDDGDNFTNTIFSDAGTESITSGAAPFTRTYRPRGAAFTVCGFTPNVNSFGAIGGGTINPNGTWILKIIDAAAGDIGVVQNWSISFRNIIFFPIVNNYVVKQRDGVAYQSSIYDNGNVGIGTNNPIANLDVVGDTLGLRNTFNADNLWFSVNNSTASINASGADNGLNFKVGNNNTGTYGDGQTLVTAMTLMPSGNVGIGTNNPIANLDVVGDTLGLRNAFNSDNLWFSVNSNTANIHASGANNGLNFKVGNNNTGTYGDGQTLVTAMTLMPSGNVGIGTTTPGQKLEVLAGTAKQAMRLSAGRGQADNDGILVIQDSSTNTAANGNNELVEFLNSAGAIIGTISRVGNANSISFNTTSDSRLKTGIRNTHYGLKDVMAIQVADYQYGNINDAALQTGFIAQQLYHVYPEAVTKGDDADAKKPYMVDYSKLTPLLVKSVQELKQQVDALQTQIKIVMDQNKVLLEDKKRHIAKVGRGKK